MTIKKEEAAKILGETPIKVLDGNNTLKYCEALEVAVEALENADIYHSALFLIGETLVEESKLHITPSEALEQIRAILKEKDYKLNKAGSKNDQRGSN